MRKLTQVSIALVLGLLVSLSMFGAGAFAQSANRTLASCDNGQGSDCNQGGCQFSGCGDTNQCATELESFKSLQVVREVEQERVLVSRQEAVTTRVLRVVREVVAIHSGWRILHAVRFIRVWQLQHAIRVLHFFQTHQVVHEVKKLVVTQHAVRVCHQS